MKNIKKFRESNTLGAQYEHRIVMMTDVEDNSVLNERDLINEISDQDNINTTIVGISSAFKSTVC